MNRILLFGTLAVGLTFGLAFYAQEGANAAHVPTPSTDGMAAAAQVEQDAPATPWLETVMPLDKRCSFNSDCPYGTCKSGRCGGCSFNSDCKGWGTCKGGWCGGCSFNSDCTRFGSCRSGRCEKSPY